MSSTAPAAQAFVDALLRLDFEALESTLQPKVEFRALVPGELVNVATASEVAQCFRRWLGDKTGLELLHLKTELLIDRWLVEYRLRLRKNDHPYLVEQHLCTFIDNGKFAVIDLVCSGFRPEGVVETAPSVHQFDAGDLGCGYGLPREFRARRTATRVPRPFSGSPRHGRCSVGFGRACCINSRHRGHAASASLYLRALELGLPFPNPLLPQSLFTSLKSSSAIPISRSAWRTRWTIVFKVSRM